MALTNAERQKRHRLQLKERAARADVEAECLIDPLRRSYLDGGKHCWPGTPIPPMARCARRIHG
jgi:hypothetical protein